MRLLKNSEQVKGSHLHAGRSHCSRVNLRIVIFKARGVSKKKQCLNYGSDSKDGEEKGKRYKRYLDYNDC